MFSVDGLRCIFPPEYSEIPLLRPPRVKTFYLLKTLFWKFKLFFSSFSTPSVHLIRDHLWNSSKGGLNIGILVYLSDFNKYL